MKALVFLPLLLCSIFFTWRWVMVRKDRRVSRTWALRAGVSLLFGVLITLALFAFLVLDSWRIW